jgi:hypothetical protein
MAYSREWPTVQTVLESFLSSDERDEWYILRESIDVLRFEADAPPPQSLGQEVRIRRDGWRNLSRATKAYRERVHVSPAIECLYILTWCQHMREHLRRLEHEARRTGTDVTVLHTIRLYYNLSSG